jgi:integrase
VVSVATAGRAGDQNEIPTLHEVDLIAKQISPQCRLSVYLQAGAGLRISETLAITADCLRSGHLRVRRQVSAKAQRDDCNAPSVRRGEEILRVAPSATHGEQDVRHFVTAMDDVWAELLLPRAW